MLAGKDGPERGRLLRMDYGLPQFVGVNESLKLWARLRGYVSVPLSRLRVNMPPPGVTSTQQRGEARSNIHRVDLLCAVSRTHWYDARLRYCSVLKVPAICLTYWCALRRGKTASNSNFGHVDSYELKQVEFASNSVKFSAIKTLFSFSSIQSCGRPVIMINQDSLNLCSLCFTYLLQQQKKMFYKIEWEVVAGWMEKC